MIKRSVDAEQILEAVHEILAPLRGERLEHEVYDVLARRIADAMAKLQDEGGEK